MSTDEPIIRLRHLCDAVRKAIEFSKGERRASLNQDESNVS